VVHRHELHRGDAEPGEVVHARGVRQPGVRPAQVLGHSVVQRGHLNEVLDIITKQDKEAFVTVEEPKVLRGGSLATREWRLGGPFVRWMKGRQRA